MDHIKLDHIIQGIRLEDEPWMMVLFRAFWRPSLQLCPALMLGTLYKHCETEVLWVLNRRAGEPTWFDQMGSTRQGQDGEGWTTGKMNWGYTWIFTWRHNKIKKKSYFMISLLFSSSGNMTHNIKKIQSILINCAVLCHKIQFSCGHIFQQMILKCLSVRISFFWHLADHRRLDGAWRQSNKRNNFHTPFLFLSHSLFAACIFTVKWNYDQRVCGCVLCVLTLVTHQWVEFWSAWSTAD